MPLKADLLIKIKNYKKRVIIAFDFNNIKIILILLVEIVTHHIKFLIVEIC